MLEQVKLTDDSMPDIVESESSTSLELDDISVDEPAEHLHRQRTFDS